MPKDNILIVDDLPANLQFLNSILAERGYQVCPAINGQVALKIAQKTLPDLILLDIQMPIMNGYQVCEQLKANDETHKIPVIFISALSDVFDKVKAFSVGGVDYVTKPFQAEEVLARVNTHLSIHKLQKQLTQQNQDLQLAKETAESVNKKVMASIEYAKLIQSSLLPDFEQIKNYLPKSFFTWMPRDIVSGDMLYFEPVAESFIVAIIDCTGHGVPGAFMTMIVVTNLKRIIKDDGIQEPSQILQHLNFLVKRALQQDTEHAKSDDGLDAALCLVKPQENKLIFAGAKLPLYCVHNGQIEVIKGDKQNLGYKRAKVDFSFTNHTIAIEAGMAFYLATDGFVDQLGGLKQFSLGSKRFKNLLLENYQRPFEKQSQTLLVAFNEYKGDNERQDDLTMVGFGF